MSEKRRKSSRDRILAVAERLFAERGYRMVSVRDITKAAGCNVAAVNYYFGSKENLYLEVIKTRIVPRARKIREHFVSMLSGRSDPGPHEVVRALCLAFFKSPIPEKERRVHQHFMAREMSHPTMGFHIIAEEVVKPMHTLLVDYLEPHFPEGTKRSEIVLFALSVFAQVAHFNYARHMVSALTDREFDESFVETLVEHVTRFSTAAIPGSGRENGD